MIPVTLLECQIESKHPLDLGANPGSSLRGALYEALAAMYDTGDAVLSRTDLDTNPVGWLLRLEDSNVSGGHDVPRPMAIRPPRQQNGRVISFELAFYGKGRETIPMVLSAVAAAGAIGIGRNRGRGNGFYELKRVNTLDPLTRQATSFIDTGQQVNELPAPPTAATYEHFASALRPDALSVRFLTPIRLIQGDHLCHQPIFRVWVQRLLERLRVLSELYAEPVWIPFRDLLSVCDSISLEHDQTRWHEAWSYSRQEGRGKPTGGFMGLARYSGPLQPLLPYLLLGQALQVGKNAIKGCGWYELIYEWK